MGQYEKGYTFQKKADFGHGFHSPRLSSWVKKFHDVLDDVQAGFTEAKNEY